MVSIKDVAKDAGVSAQTVSNYLNNPRIVKPSTRELVAASIQRLGYTPNASARRLRTQRSNTIAIGIAPISKSMVYDRLLHAIATEADVQNLRILLYKADSKHNEIEQFDSLIAQGDVDAFVLTDTAHDDPRVPWLIAHQQTFVLFGRPWGLSNLYDPDVPWVDVDGHRGILDMTRSLILQGRKHIGFIGWPGISGTGHDRYLGWHDAMIAARMGDEPHLQQLYAEATDDIAASREACSALIQRNPQLDAIICVSDTLAAGAALALPEQHPAIVTGFDNTATSQSLGLPTIDQPLAESAREIIRIIQERLDGLCGGNTPERQATHHHVLLPPHVIMR